MTRHWSLGLPGAALLVAAAPSPSLAPSTPQRTALPGTLVVALAPATSTEALRRLVLRPATAAAGLTLREPSWDGRLAMLDRLGASLVELDASSLQAGCAAGTLSAPDWPQSLRERVLRQAVSRCGLGVALRSTALAWDRDKLSGTPEWADFWDVAKHPGKRGLHKGPRDNLEIALLADGVAPADVYAQLSSSAGVDRAFRKLDQLRPYVVWWQRAAEPARLLATGAVLLTSAPAEHIAQAEVDPHHSFGITFSHSLYTIDAWALPKSAATPGVAGQPLDGTMLRLLDALQDPQHQAAFASASRLGVTSHGANDQLGAAAESLPSAPKNLDQAMQSDEAFWATNLDALTARFNAWLAT